MTARGGWANLKTDPRQTNSRDALVRRERERKRRGGGECRCWTQLTQLCEQSKFFYLISELKRQNIG